MQLAVAYTVDGQLIQIQLTTNVVLLSSRIASFTAHHKLVVLLPVYVFVGRYRPMSVRHNSEFYKNG